jgi:hypothetical protein
MTKIKLSWEARGNGNPAGDHREGASAQTEAVRQRFRVACSAERLR